MPLDNLFTYNQLEKVEDNYIFQLEISQNHNVYKGHFPEYPVVPGVCQVEVLRKILSSIFEKEVRLISAKDIRFLGMMTPKDTPKPTLNFSLKQQDENLIVKASFIDNEKVITKIRATFKIEL